MKNHEQFLAEVQKIDPSINSLDEAISLSLQMVPKVDEMTWFGAVGNGIFHANSRESRFFPHMNEKEAAQQLIKEIYL